MAIITIAKIKMIKKLIVQITSVLLITACTLSPGMVEPNRFNKNINIVDIDEQNVELDYSYETYTVSSGDTLSIVIFGVDDFFPPVSNYQNPYTSRIVDNNGQIFFPYAGVINVSGKTTAVIREELTLALSKNFKDPQVDVTITDFNIKRNIYVLGEVKEPNIINLGIVPISLSDAISQSGGLSNTSSNGKRVFIIRADKVSGSGKVYRMNMNNASSFLLSSKFYLQPGDIVFVGAADITKWNRFITQLFPFASFLNQVDNIEN